MNQQYEIGKHFTIIITFIKCYEKKAISHLLSQILAPLTSQEVNLFTWKLILKNETSLKEQLFIYQELSGWRQAQKGKKGNLGPSVYVVLLSLSNFKLYGLQIPEFPHRQVGWGILKAEVYIS